MSTGLSDGEALGLLGGEGRAGSWVRGEEVEVEVWFIKNGLVDQRKRCGGGVQFLTRHASAGRLLLLLVLMCCW